MNESSKSQPETIETQFAVIIDKLKNIETLLKRSQRAATSSYLNSTGLTGMAVGMGLVVANPKYAMHGLFLFFVGCVLSIITSWLPRRG
mgnify:CR=1 FL=1